MDLQLFARLAGLPRLDSGNRHAASCKICGGRAAVFDVVDFNKLCSQDIYSFGLSGIAVPYLRCSVCRFMFTQFFDDWSPQDFARFVYNEDYIKVDGEYSDSRPKREAAAMAERISEFSDLNILDYGSGSGRFAQYLGSGGFRKVSSYDPFSSPARPDGRFDLITCFEVLEHSTSPGTTLADIVSFLGPGGCIIFSTGIQPPSIGEIRANWWYVAPRNGHVSIYTLDSLRIAGQAAGLVLYAGLGGMAFGEGGLSAISRRILSAIGRAVECFHLTAPDDNEFKAEQEHAWYDLEGSGAEAFRWTRATEITWRLQVEPLIQCQLSLAIPLKNEIQPGFASRCQLTIGGKSVPLTRNGIDFCASLSVEDAVDATVTLITPPLVRPCDFRDVTDARPLGIAISTRSAVRQIVD